MVERFLRYSLERQRKICVVMMEDGKMKKTNLLVTQLDENKEGFTARRPGRKKEERFLLGDILTAAYARGDQGELE